MAMYGYNITDPVGKKNTMGNQVPTCHILLRQTMSSVRECPSIGYRQHFWFSNKCWLVVSTPLKNISQLGWLFPLYGKIKNVLFCSGCQAAALGKQRRLPLQPSANPSNPPTTSRSLPPGTQVVGQWHPQQNGTQLHKNGNRWLLWSNKPIGKMVEP